MGLDTLAEDFGREYVARLLVNCGRSVQSEALRNLRSDPNAFPEAWGNPAQVKAVVRDVMHHVARMAMGTYLTDLLAAPLKKTVPKMGDSFHEWSTKAGIYYRTEYFLKEMPLDLESKWLLIIAILQLQGYDLNNATKCFIKYQGKG